MRKTLVFCLTHCLFSCAFSQMLKTKDDVAIGYRSEFMKSCVDAADESLINLNGIEFEAINYCSCVCDKIIPTLYSYDIDAAVKADTLIGLLLRGENVDIILDCCEGNLTMRDDYKFQTEDNKSGAKLAKRKCVEGLMADTLNLNVWTTQLAQDYCDCMIDKLYSNGYTIKDLKEIDNENRKVYNEIIIPCMNEIFQDGSQVKTQERYVPADIIGVGEKSEVDLIDYLGLGYKIKISIDGIEQYFLLDTGASDLTINRKVERELLLNGSLTKDNYIGTQAYVLANNMEITAQVVEMDNITIGEYTINNVRIAIMEEGNLLCGKQFLDKFSKWELLKEEQLIILYK
jgi:clan AA aspartic protease (TIGR02281 family)